MAQKRANQSVGVFRISFEMVFKCALSLQGFACPGMLITFDPFSMVRAHRAPLLNGNEHWPRELQTAHAT